LEVLMSENRILGTPRIGILIVAAIAVVVIVGCGDSGAAGADGADGTNGVDGTDGGDGADGADGTDFPGPVPPEFTAADGIAGGATYSKWWTTEAGGSGTQPVTTAAADFYRCKACHAWDGQGNAASYADRTGQSTLKDTRPDVSAVNLRSTAAALTFDALFDLVQHAGARDIDAADNSHPNYTNELTDDQVWNLIKFMRQEWVVPDLLYDIAVTGPQMYVDYNAVPAVVVAPEVTYSNVGALGDEANGQVLNADLCATCHGADGTLLDIGGRSLGQFVREKPHEAWFKVKFGEPGTGMNPGLITATSDLQDLYAALANPTNFPDP